MESRASKSRKIAPSEERSGEAVGVKKSEVMDQSGKRHPSSFQQLEKLGEGTYATVIYSFDFHSRRKD